MEEFGTYVSFRDEKALLMEKCGWFVLVYRIECLYLGVNILGLSYKGLPLVFWQWKM